jgi:hypothetical protein
VFINIFMQHAYFIAVMRIPGVGVPTDAGFQRDKNAVIYAAV